MKPALPRLGLGMAALGRPGYINLNRDLILGTERPIELMQKQADQVMDKLFQIAINEHPWLDCARSYGLSEKFVGEYLRRNKVSADQVYVSSKWGYTYVADWKVKLEDGEPHEVKDHSTENFLKQLKETSECLGEYINLYQIHSATFESGILTDKKCHEALSRCKDERGWSIGLSVSSPKQSDVLREAMKIKSTTKPDQPLFDSVQCTFNCLEQKPAVALQEAHDQGMDIIIKEGLANGRILRDPSLLKFARQLSCGPDQLALAFILAQPFEPRVLSGSVTPEQLESNWKALEVSKKLKDQPALLKDIAKKCVIESEAYWAERSALAWN